MGRIQKHRRIVIPFFGIGLLTFVCGPLLYSFTASQAQTQSLGQISAESDSETYAQTDDLIRDPSAHWPQMSREKLEKTREALIEEGFSPIQADSILPYAQNP